MMMRTGAWRERHVSGRPLSSQEKAFVVVLALFVAALLAGLLAVVVIETRNQTECGGAVTNTPNAPQPQPPPAAAARSPRL